MPLWVVQHQVGWLSLHTGWLCYSRAISCRYLNSFFAFQDIDSETPSLVRTSISNLKRLPIPQLEADSSCPRTACLFCSRTPPSASLFLCRTLSLCLVGPVSLALGRASQCIISHSIEEAPRDARMHAHLLYLPGETKKAALLSPIRHPFFLHTRWPAPPPGYAQTAPAASIFLRR